MADGSARPSGARYGHRAVYRGPLLELTDVTREDGGEYGCEAANTEGVTWTTVNINVICEYFACQYLSSTDSSRDSKNARNEVHTPPKTFEELPCSIQMWVGVRYSRNLKKTWVCNLKDLIRSIQAFVDDFVLVSHAPTRVKLESQISESIAKFSTWTSKNQLQISAEKTNYLLISKLVRGPTIRWQSERIKRAHAIKYLGVYIDEKMNWNTHLKAQSTRATKLHQNLLKIAGKSWGVPLNHRRILYKTVIERVLAHGTVAWCLEPTVRVARKLSTIQRPFLLATLGAYRATSTAALQVILGIPPLHLQLQREARGTALRLRLPLSTNFSDIDPSEIEEKATGWSAHPSEHLSPTQISLDDGANISTGHRIYINGSKTENGVGAAFCVLTDVNITHRWSTRLSLRNTVFQAEILALLKAVEHVVALPTQQLSILVDNQASIK
ncbi:Putative protein in type-1 retrotransposable element R1DM [Araneus ventricosus]|uniref:Uncharacterized protein n=1 Tax=Araneus ventricosus TaxID=182803 RepID=A0A4Y2E8B7_ARAVE|nr:Putative protein in type-1 retrotransposable element R1DM [Araneus ventricosus]